MSLLNSRTLIQVALTQDLTEKITLCGMVQNLRDFKHHAFIGLRDRSGYIQTVLSKSPQAKLPTIGSILKIEGTLKAEPKAPGGKELNITELSILSSPTEELPVMLEFANKETLDTVIDNRALSIRNPWVNAVFRIQALIAKAFRQTLERHGCLEIHTPKFVAGGTEGGAEVFAVEYFERTAYLAQSPQLYKQISAGAFEGVYEIGPVFRAENSQTIRHLTEFTGLDLELCYINDEQDVMSVVEEFIREIYLLIGNTAANTLSFLGTKLPALTDIPRITHQTAEQLVEKHGTHDIEKNWDKAVSLAVKHEYNSAFVFVYGYPKSEKPFYIMPDETNPKYTRSFDLLCNGLELCSGGQRINSLEQLTASLRSHGLNPESYPGYLDAFKYGMPPHGGAGLGLERITQILLGLGNVREATLFPRDVKRLTP